MKPDKTMTAAIKAELDNAVVVRPGDKLVLLSSVRQMDMATADAIRKRVMEELPGVEPVIIAGFDQMTVYREGDDSAIGHALREIWNWTEESDEAISPARLRRVIVESGAWRGHEDDE